MQNELLKGLKEQQAALLQLEQAIDEDNDLGANAEVQEVVVVLVMLDNRAQHICARRRSMHCRIRLPRQRTHCMLQAYPLQGTPVIVANRATKRRARLTMMTPCTGTPSAMPTRLTMLPPCRETTPVSFGHLQLAVQESIHAAAAAAASGPQAGPTFALWERHTRGIGSKLLASMGHKAGQGLGARQQGIATPLEVVLGSAKAGLGAVGTTTS